MTPAALALLLVVAFPGPAQDGAARAAPPPAYDLAPTLREKVPVAVTVERRILGSMSLELGGVKQKQALSHQASIVFVDEFEKVGVEEPVAVRTCVKYQVTDDGVPSDPGLEGTAIEYTFGNETRVHLRGARRARQSMLNALLAAQDSIYGHLVLPNGVAVGQSFSVDFAGLVPLLLDSDDGVTVASAQATLTLDEVSPDGKLAKLSGKAEIAESLGVIGVTVRLEVKGGAKVEFDLESHRLARLALDGKGAFASDTLPVSGGVTINSWIALEGGAAAEAALKTKPAYREVVRPIDKAGVTVKLPSYWIDVGTDDSGDTKLISSLGGPHESLNIAISSYPSEGLSIEKYGEQFEKSFAQAGSPPPKAKAVSSPLGNGRQIRTVKEGQDLQVEVYPLGKDRVVLYRFYGKPEAFKIGLKDFEKARSTLKALKP